MDLLRNKLLFLSCFFGKQGLQLAGYTILLVMAFIAMALAWIAFTGPAQAATRIKDIVTVEGIRDNILIGYGLVVGLNGTGDKLTNSTFTEKSLQAYLNRLGVNTSDAALKVKNVAAVTVTATLPPFARAGARIDVTVSTMGDAKSLQGGMLIATPLMGADNNVYAVAQGAVAIGGFEASGNSGSSISKGVPTNGFISNGAIIEREIAFELNSLSELDLALRNPDITTAGRMAAAINIFLKSSLAEVRDPGTVRLTVPDQYRNAVASLLARIEHLEVEPDQTARIIIDEASGTIVMNENVRVDTVAIAQGNLVVTIDEETQVSQPGAFSGPGAQTAEIAATQISVDEDNNARMAMLESNATLRDLVNGLNALGVGPRDMINILQTIKMAGALQAEIETR